MNALGCDRAVVRDSQGLITPQLTHSAVARTDAAAPVYPRCCIPTNIPDATEGKTDYPVLTDRRNVIVVADEAHRSQYGFCAKVKSKTGAISYGFAKYLRDALPNASFIGFTGTPIEKDDVSTPAVFGDYIDIYDISRAV